MSESKKKVVVISAQGYWGAGDDLKTASKNAHGLGGYGVIYFCTLRGEGAEVYVDGMGSLCWKGEMEYHSMYFRNGRIVVDPDKKRRKAKAK